MQIVLVCEIFYMEEEEERGSQIGNEEVFRVEATRKREREREKWEILGMMNKVDIYSRHSFFFFFFSVESPAFIFSFWRYY